MPNKYKHIRIPNELHGEASGYMAHKQGRPPELPGFEDKPAYKGRLAAQAESLEEFAEETVPSRRIDRDRDFVDLKIKVQGTLYPRIFTKYNLKVGLRYDDREPGQEYSNDTIIAKVKNVTLPDQEKSDFERLEEDLKTYVESPKDKLKSYFGLVEELTPIVPEAVINGNLMSKIKDDPSEKRYLDIVFSDNQEAMEEKISDIQALLGDDFVGSVNTRLVHTCHVHVNSSELKNIFDSYGGIIEVEESMKIIFGSSAPISLGEYELKVTARNQKPILIADEPIQKNHELLEDVFEGQVGSDYQEGGDGHGTQVASLAVYGTRLNNSGRLVLENKIASVNIMKPIEDGASYTFDTNNLQTALAQYYDPAHVLLTNLSINSTEVFYRRSTPHWFTVLIDELSVKYNCLFIISAGNLFNDNWSQELVRKVLNMGYPNHFAAPCCMILPPADSLNCLSVGSVAYASTPNSISAQNEPTFITRRGLVDVKGFNLIKPDLVHYDSNYATNFVSEDNGPFMACVRGGVIRGAGTSFAAPLVTHDAGLIAQSYPDYKVNTIKALLIHFARSLNPAFALGADIKSSLVGHGIPDIERALYSLSHSSTLIIEDSIKVNTTKKIRIPIPGSIAGSRTNRLRLRKTLVYNPRINNKDINLYNPIYITAKIVREDKASVDSSFSQDYINGAHKTSNVKAYKAVEMSTVKHMGTFWEVEVMAEAANDQVNSNYSQDYSIVITVEDIKEDGNLNLHEEIHQMIEAEVGVGIEINI